VFVLRPSRASVLTLHAFSRFCFAWLTVLFSELQNLRRTSEQDLRAQLREEMRNEIRLALAQTPEVRPCILSTHAPYFPSSVPQSSSLGTKRKRGDDEVEVFGTDVVPTAVSAAPRPCKRLRTVADFAAASAVGALGAWLGLAYL